MSDSTRYKIKVQLDNKKYLNTYNNKDYYKNLIYQALNSSGILKETISIEESDYCNITCWTISEIISASAAKTTVERIRKIKSLSELEITVYRISEVPFEQL